MNKIREGNKGIAVYHCVEKYEGFSQAAQDIYNLVKMAKDQYPNKTIGVYLDVKGHKNKEGGFDDDMFELLTYFIMEMIMPYISELHQPLGDFSNPHPKNEVMKELKIVKEESYASQSN